MDAAQNTDCRCPDCSSPMCDNCGKKKGEYVLPGEGSAMLSCGDCKDEILSHDVLARDWTSTGDRCEDCLSQETTGPTFQGDFQDMNKSESNFEKAWSIVKEDSCDHDWEATKWVCTNKNCEAEITDADTEDVGDCLNHDDHNWKPRNYKCHKCGVREE